MSRSKLRRNRQKVLYGSLRRLSTRTGGHLICCRVRYRHRRAGRKPRSNGHGRQLCHCMKPNGRFSMPNRRRCRSLNPDVRRLAGAYAEELGMDFELHAITSVQLEPAALGGWAWYAALAGILIVMAVLAIVIYLHRLRSRERKDVRGLYVRFLRNGLESPRLAAPNRFATTFSFVIRDEDIFSRPARPDPGEAAFAVRRGRRPEEFTVTTTSGESLMASLDDTGIDLGNGIRLLLDDGRRRRRPGPPSEVRFAVGRGTDPAPVQRYLRCRCPDAVAPGRVFSLMASVGVSGSNVTGETASLLKPFDVPGSGANVLLVVEAPGMRWLGRDRHVIVVPQSGDSEPVLFEFVAGDVGLRHVSVTAWQDGSRLGELRAVITVRRDPPDRPARQIEGEISAAYTPGEVTLVVRRDGPRFRFEFRDADNPPEIQAEMPYDPGPKILRLLDDLAAGVSGYPSGIAERYVANVGEELWKDLIPDSLKRQFWERRDHIRQLTVLTDTDTVPWELLYTKDSGQDEGFLVEQFPLTRAVFGRIPPRALSLTPARFVVPPGSPPGAYAEVAALRAILEPPTGPVITTLSSLLDLIDRGDFGILHFACHNCFDPSSGSAIRMDALFTPVFLTGPGSERALAASEPLVFINACTSAGQVPSYNRLDGWAWKFLEAGAGVFIGSQWSVRDEAACEFATSLYTNLKLGLNLGQSAMRARQSASDGSAGDPTWLACAIYGHAEARSSGDSIPWL